jgi:hypothetical protein
MKIFLHLSYYIATYQKKSVCNVRIKHQQMEGAVDCKYFAKIRRILIASVM